MRFSDRLMLIAATLAFLLPASLAHAGSPSEVVKGFYSELAETMKEGPKLGFEGRYKKLEPAVTSAFDLAGMARLAVGPAWAQANETQRAAMVKAFTAFSVATYASRFKKYDGERFDVTGEKPAAQGTIVETTLTPQGESPVILNYMVRKDATGAPRIMDVYLDAAISELATRRSDFGAVIKAKGFDALIRSLEEKVETMKSKVTG